MIRRRSRPVGGPPGPSGVCFGFLDFACAFPPAYAATEAQPGLAPVRIRASYVPNHELEAEHPGRPPAVATAPVDADVALVTRAVDELNRQVDHVIVSYRWGVPGMRQPLDYQRALGHATVDAGASVVLGHHAHVLQPVEAYGRGLILYGLSHFIFDLPDIISRFGFDTETAAVSIDFARDEIRGASLIPMVMEEGADPRRPDAGEAERVYGLLRELSAPYGTAIEWDALRAAVRVRLQGYLPATPFTAGRQGCPRSSASHTAHVAMRPRDRSGQRATRA